MQYAQGMADVFAVALPGQKCGQREPSIAHRAGVCPCAIEFFPQHVDDRAVQFHHQVVPDVAVLATDIHPAGKGNPVIYNGRLHVIAGHQPGVLGLSHVDIRSGLEGLANGVRRLVVGRHRRVVGAGRNDRTQPVEEYAHGHAVFGAPPQQVPHPGSKVVVVEYVGADVDRLRRSRNRVDIAYEELIPVDQIVDRAPRGLVPGYAGELFLPRFQVHGRTVTEFGDRFGFEGRQPARRYRFDGDVLGDEQQAVNGRYGPEHEPAEMALGNVPGRLCDTRRRAGGATRLRRRRIAHEDADRYVTIDEDERQRVGPGVTGTEDDAPVLDALFGKKTIEHGLRTLDEFHEVDRFGDHVVVGLLDDQP